jgi:hypothetical protein
VIWRLAARRDEVVAVVSPGLLRRERGELDLGVFEELLQPLLSRVRSRIRLRR